MGCPFDCLVFLLSGHRDIQSPSKHSPRVYDLFGQGRNIEVKVTRGSVPKKLRSMREGGGQTMLEINSNELAIKEVSTTC